jgi:hypothetical protein
LKEDNPLALWSRLLNDSLIVSGGVPSSEELLRERREKAGFVDVQTFTLVSEILGTLRSHGLMLVLYQNVSINDRVSAMSALVRADK